MQVQKDALAKIQQSAKDLFMNDRFFLYFLLCVLLASSGTVFAGTLSYGDKAAQCSEHGNQLCWRYCLAAEKQQAAGQAVKFGRQCDTEFSKQFTNTPYQSKTDPNYLPSGSTWLDSGIVGIYRRSAGRSRHVIDAPTSPGWKEKCASVARIEPAEIKSLQENGKTLQKGIKVRLSKIQVTATPGNQFSCKAGKIEVLD
ncbi:hypothetical protein [Neptunomonas phycophila]|uniref:hypothetical protein n=1 Tax=Neptunomonas phycophila TaxID=1572645 RepID=UPI003516BAB5